MMHKIYQFWAALAILACILSLYFSIEFVKEFYDYSVRSKKVSIDVCEWRIREVKGKYIILAKYTYIFLGKEYKAVSAFSNKYLNQNSALQEVRKYSKLSWNAFLDPTNPSIIGIDRSIPYNTFLRSFFSLLVFLYLGFLKRSYFKRLT